MTKISARDYFVRYQNAFSSLNVEAIADLWFFPAVIHSPVANWVLSEDDFSTNTRNLCDFYTRQGMRSVEAVVTEFNALTADVASVRVKYALRDCDDQTFIEWEHAYVLRDRAGDVRAISAICDDEIVAWKRRGTPLEN